ncbi:MAG: flagellar assembly protein FliX [Alphaproteobacteria bacterium]|nr:flagellar assembly protein FliX [Alphaproteobacteria bacterium]
MISRIDGTSPIRSTTPVRRTNKASGSSSSSFSKHLDETDESSGVHGAAALGGVNGMLDLQEVDDALARAARGKLRAEDLLEKLDDLRMDLLTGALSKTKLQRLSDVVNSHRAEVSDPKLNNILDEIDLRAQVELAKFTSA